MEILLFHRKVLFWSGFVIPWDFRYYHFPLASFIARSFQRGELPLWDPYTYCGMPLYADLTAQVFYPPAALTILVSNWTGGAHLFYLLELQLIAHIWLAGWFAFWMLRRLNLDRIAALLGASIFQLGGFFASQAQHLGAVDGAAWLPLAWLAVLSLQSGLRWRWVGALASSFAMSILAGFPAVTAVIFGSSLLLAVTLIAFRRAGVRLLGGVALAAAWAGCLAAVQLLPTLELTRLSVAALRGEWLGTGGGLPFQSLISLIAPNHYGIFDVKTYGAPWNLTFLYLYCSLPGLGLAIIALARKTRQTAIFGLLTACFALWMLGDSTPIGRSLFPLLPKLLKSALYAEFAMLPFLLGMATLAALGSQSLFRSRVLRVSLLVATAFDLLVTGSSRPMNTAAIQEEPGITREHFDGNRELLDDLRQLVNQTIPPARIDTVDDAINWAGTASLTEIPTANGIHPFALARLIRARLSFCKGEPWGRYYQVSDPNSRVLDLMNVRYLLSRTPIPDGNKIVKIAELPGHAVYQNTTALPRFFLVNRVHSAKSLEEALAVLRSPRFDPSREAIVEGDVEWSEGGPIEHCRVSLVAYGDRKIELETECPESAFLVTSEAYYPGWTVRMEGKARNLLMTNGAFRGLFLNPGDHRIEMIFKPRVLMEGAAGSLAGLLLLAVAFWNRSQRF